MAFQSFSVDGVGKTHNVRVDNLLAGRGLVQVCPRGENGEGSDDGLLHGETGVQISVKSIKLCVHTSIIILLLLSFGFVGFSCFFEAF